MVSAFGESSFFAHQIEDMFSRRRIAPRLLQVNVQGLPLLGGGEAGRGEGGEGGGRGGELVLRDSYVTCGGRSCIS